MKTSPHILVVDDEIKLTEVVRSYLENSGYRVSEAHTGRAAIESFESEALDLVILDLMLPDISGEEICRIIRKKSRVPIIMLTARVEEENILNGLEIGADDYVTKPFSPRQLMARVAAVLRRTLNNEESSHILEFNLGELLIDDVKHEVKRSSQPISLTPNEYKILFAMASHPKKVFTRDELVCIALGETYEGYDRNIDTHIKNLRQKIELDPRNPKYIITVYGIGYRFGGE